MIDALLRSLPLSAFDPLREILHACARRNPARVLSTKVLVRAARAYRGHLSARLEKVRPVDRPDLVFKSVDSMVMDAVYWIGVRGYEGVVAQTWGALCRNARSVLEIGGNVGLFTVVGAKTGVARYTVVEPVPANVRTLQDNLILNGIRNVVVQQAAAVPGNSRDVVLSIPSEGRAMPVGAQMLDGDLKLRHSAGQIMVPGIGMSELASGCDLIKIDAEGIETALLEDIRGTLVERKPTLLVEVLPEADRLGAFLRALAAEAGYAIYVLPGYGSDDRTRIEASEFTSLVPGRFKAKDVVLHMGPLPT